MIFTDVESAVKAAKVKFLSSRITEKFCKWHPKTLSVGSFVDLDCEFTDYGPCCNICIGTFVNNQKKFFTKLLKDPSIGGSIVCEVCDILQYKYLRTKEGLEENFHVYKESENSNWIYMCGPCYDEQKALDRKYYEEELCYKQE